MTCLCLCLSLVFGLGLPLDRLCLELGFVFFHLIELGLPLDVFVLLMLFKKKGRALRVLPRGP